MTLITKTFQELARRREGTLIAYVMGGDPTPERCLEIAESVVRSGADVIELGIPFSDPIADGSAIQAAGVRALSAGTRPSQVLEIAKKIKERHTVPVVLMTYFNILFKQGVERFLSRARECGVDGIIIPDLPLDEVGGYSELAKRNGIDTILLAAPTTTPERMRMLVSHTSGFLYLVSLLGVTGIRQNLQEGTVSLVRYAKKYTKGKIPLAVGFGISKPEHVRAVLEAGSDGAIVGSGIVNYVASNLDDTERMLREIERYVDSLKSATRTHA